MIFPLILGLRSVWKAPVTWMIFVLNVLVLLWGWSVAWTDNDRLDALMGDDFFLETQGHVYESFIKQNDSTTPEIIRQVASTGSGDVHHFRLMGHLAFRDEAFLSEAPRSSLFSDKVALRHWRRHLREIRELEAVHPSFLMGISTDVTDLKLWVTYIFSHTSGWHFFGNMVFLLLFGAALEEVIGGLGLLVVFLACGVFAAGFFLWLNGPTTAPLIGASGAVSGIMAMYSVLCWKRPVRYLYWLLIPTREAMGFVFLPAWTILAIWLLGDLAGYLGNLDIMGGVAHAAHIGGDIAGALAGLILVLLWRCKKLEPTPATVPVETWRLYPLFHLSRWSKSPYR